jgi:CDP-glucose 4,6-dehydratase
LEKLGMNLRNPDPNFWRNRSVFLTGHTGFKGGWLSLWLWQMGARVYGYALAPPTKPSFFEETKLESKLVSSTINDIRDLKKLSASMQEASPSVVIHMAAQPLVRESYNTPVDTFSTNLLGTVNLLEATRTTGSVRAIVNITTDKCYENHEWLWPYRESDRLGGHDPYSSSKACAEFASAAYRKSFLADAGVHLATVRAGNVVGGGDWAVDRLIPDFFRALDSGETLYIRSPNAIRPWQHVLEPLSGYLLLGEELVKQGAAYADAWNFGPEELDTKPVSVIIKHLSEKFPGSRWQLEYEPQPHEAGLLKLDSSKARTKLNWAPRWPLKIALNKTIEWHQAWKSAESMAAFTAQQIDAYQAA